MKIAVIAANGRTGQEFVRLALGAGHKVTAGIHSINNLGTAPGLVVMKCDATSQVDVTRLLEGQDAVVSFIGHGRNSPPDVQTKATEVIVTVMNKLNQKRLVSLTGTGVRRSNDKITLIDYLLNTSIRIIDPTRVQDGIKHAEVLMNSGLDWTVLRVLKLTNGHERPYTLKLNGPAKSFIARSEVAKAVLEILVQRKFIKQLPIVSKL